MIITIDPDAPVPPFEQLRSGIRRLVATGGLGVGAKLPTVRQLAADLGVAPGTVARAYRELESEGIIATRGRHGTTVKGRPAPPRANERTRLLREAARAYAAVAAELAVDPDAAIDEVREALAP